MEANRPFRHIVRMDDEVIEGHEALQGVSDRISGSEDNQGPKAYFDRSIKGYDEFPRFSRYHLTHLTLSSLASW